MNRFRILTVVVVASTLLCAVSVEAKTLELTVRMLTGRKIPVTAESTDNVEHLKKAIAEPARVPIDQQRLIYDGTKLEDGKTLQEYRIPSGATLNLVILQKHAVVTRVACIPSAAKVRPGQSFKIVAAAYDQDGNRVTQDFTFSSTGGTITGDGTYTAGDKAGRYEATATLGASEKSCSTVVTVEASPEPQR